MENRYVAPDKFLKTYLFIFMGFIEFSLGF